MSFLLWLTTVPIVCQLLELVKYILMKALKTSPLPNHVAFIMDGNRRFAREKNLPVSAGHESGSDTLGLVLELCYKLGISTVSIYAFSIENFKRLKSEVAYLMSLIKKKLLHILENGELVDRFGVRIVFSGNFAYLPKDVLEAFQEVQQKTAHNNSVILNVCFPYTARDDMVRSIRKILTQNIPPEDISEQTIENNLDTGSLPPLDFLIRTSGVSRLSDYLLWEVTSGAQIELVDVYWPQLNQVLLAWSFFKWSVRQASKGFWGKED